MKFKIYKVRSLKPKFKIGNIVEYNDMINISYCKIVDIHKKYNKFYYDLICDPYGDGLYDHPEDNYEDFDIKEEDIWYK